MMVYVSRNVDGNINGVYANLQSGYATEEISEADPSVVAFLNPPKPQTVLSQDLMAQFTVSDFAAIKSAVAGSDEFGLLWASLQTQKDPMLVTNARFLNGWHALVQVLTQPRMDAIATALGVTALV